MFSVPQVPPGHMSGAIVTHGVILSGAGDGSKNCNCSSFLHFKCGLYSLCVGEGASLVYSLVGPLGAGSGG